MQETSAVVLTLWPWLLEEAKYPFKTFFNNIPRNCTAILHESMVAIHMTTQ